MYIHCTSHHSAARASVHSKTVLVYLDQFTTCNKNIYIVQCYTKIFDNVMVCVVILSVSHVCHACIMRVFEGGDWWSCEQ